MSRLAIFRAALNTATSHGQTLGKLLFRYLVLVPALLAACTVPAANGFPLSTPEKPPQSMRIIVEKDNGSTIEVRLGDLVLVSLPENATTGYRWAIDHYNQELIEAVATEPHYESKAIGSGGEVDFIFKGKQLGVGEIMLKHWRQWEGDQSVIGRFQLRLHVTP